METYMEVTSGDITLLVEREVLTTFFSCDYASCKGACCWQKHPTETLEGGAVLESERDSLVAMGCNPTDFIQHDGYYTTRLDGNEKCVFCGEKGCLLKELRYKAECADIPVHCNLFPLIAVEEEGKLKLKFSHLFEQWCKPSYGKGKAENRTIVEFERVPLTKLFGETVYRALRDLSRSIMGE